MLLVADILLIIHVLLAAFITFGFLLIPLGARRHWGFVRSRRLRLLHLGGILVVAAEALLGIACPLTVWENLLRGGDAEAGFIATAVRHLLYYDVPLWIFSVVYVTAAVLALVLWRAVPPAPRARLLPAAKSGSPP